VSDITLRVRLDDIVEADGEWWVVTEVVDEPFAVEPTSTATCVNPDTGETRQFRFGDLKVVGRS